MFLNISLFFISISIGSHLHHSLQDYCSCFPSGVSKSSSATTVASIPYTDAARVIFEKSKSVTLLCIQNSSLTPHWQQKSIFSKVTLKGLLLFRLLICYSQCETSQHSSNMLNILTFVPLDLLFFLPKMLFLLLMNSYSSLKTQLKHCLLW